MKPNLIAKRSLWSCGKTIFLCILLSWLIIPIFILIIKILQTKSESIEFYNNKIIIRKGFLNKNERQTAMTKIMAVTLQQTLFGRMFNYGSISVDVVGKWDVDFTNLKKPHEVKNYLETIISNTDYESMHQMVHN